jgi:N,N-dimethylformamidase beta subunit-like, C-terminal
MATVTAHLNCRGARNASLLLALASPIAAILLGFGTKPHSQEELEGRAPTAEELRPSVEAAFPHESYAPGTSASLVIFNDARGVKVRIFHIGPEHAHTVGNSQMQGVPVTGTEPIGMVRKGSAVQIRVGNWTSGLYFARLTASDGRVGFAPFIVRPRSLGEHRVAVVLPTLTWQAYNLRDDNGDGKGDTWYANWKVHTARLGRPFLNRGVPYNFRCYDLPFLHWLAWTGRQVDLLSDGDLDGVQSGQALASAYDLIVFPGHHEYVTTHEYDLVQSYRDLGGNLAFLSANNFFWRVVRHGSLMEKTGQWRDYGRPEASLIGVQYRGNDRGGHRGPWIVRDTSAARWLFAGTGLKDGSTFGDGGIEIDKTAAESPSGVKVLAEIPNLFGSGFTAQMTYYETRAGAKVFAAGAFTLAGSVLNDPAVNRLMQNLWTWVASP